MRDLYYADNRDLVKWAVLVHIAHTHKLRSIIQVPYWRVGKQHHFMFGGIQIPIQKAVWDFFRDIRQIVRLGECCDIGIEVIMEPFSHTNRRVYSNHISRHLEACDKRPLLLFLDPDTGLAPRSTSPEHTTPEEIKEVWSRLHPNEFLVLYQHAPRQYRPGWFTIPEEKLSRICDGAEVVVARSDEIGRDVAFLCVQKPLQNPENSMPN
jgi:hypothetical protein